MQQLNRKNATAEAPYPEVVLQFGGGNFVRAFTDWIIDTYNEKKQSRMGVLVATTTQRRSYTEWDEQDGLFHLITKGINKGTTIDETRLIKCVSRVIAMEPEWETFLRTAENPATRYIISNTTEAGIRFSPEDRLNQGAPSEFPGKLTLWLLQRFNHFKGSAEAGCVFFPVELINDNGDALRTCLLRYCEHWDLDPAFARWIESANYFCNSLVDRIVPGVGRDELPATLAELGFNDSAVTQGEPYHLWAIEAPLAVREELPLDEIGLNVVFTEDLAPYRLSKVRILNGAHTSLVPVGLLAGLDTVGEAVNDELVGPFIQQAIFAEIIPSLDLPELDLNGFAEAILDRFRNPFIHHRLLSISLNSIAKFRERVLPSILEYHEQQQALPPALCLSFACLIQFYKGEEFPLNDEAWVVDHLKGLWDACDGTPESTASLVEAVLGWEKAWKQNLTKVPGLREELTGYLLDTGNREGVRQAILELKEG